MTVRDLADILSASTVNEADFSREVTGGYAGDLLSFVMGRAPENSAWYTVMTNVNVAAVAVLTDVAVVVLCEGCASRRTGSKRNLHRGGHLLRHCQGGAI